MPKYIVKSILENFKSFCQTVLHEKRSLQTVDSTCRLTGSRIILHFFKFIAEILKSHLLQ
jgi:hypothetical protein